VTRLEEFMNNIILIFSVVCLLSACATARKITLPSGAEGYDIKCRSREFPACNYEADKVCPNGYDVISSDHQGATIYSDDYLFMLIECK
jgi:hypothetical protein